MKKTPAMFCLFPHWALIHVKWSCRRRVYRKMFCFLKNWDEIWKSFRRVITTSVYNICLIHITHQSSLSRQQEVEHEATSWSHDLNTLSLPPEEAVSLTTAQSESEALKQTAASQLFNSHVSWRGQSWWTSRIIFTPELKKKKNFGLVM